MTHASHGNSRCLQATAWVGAARSTGCHARRHAVVGANPERTTCACPSRPETGKQNAAGQPACGGTRRHQPAAHVRVRDEEVAGSNPVTPTNKRPGQRVIACSAIRPFDRLTAAWRESGETILKSPPQALPRSRHHTGTTDRSSIGGAAPSAHPPRFTACNARAHTDLQRWQPGDV
jgi:hypothetical protein